MTRGAAIGEDGPHPVDRYVGHRVAEKRISLGINQRDLGLALGVTFQQIRKYETGANRISSSKLWEMAQFLGADISFFFEGLPTAPAGAANKGDAFDHAYPATRQTVEIGRLASRLSSRDQTLALDLLRAVSRSKALIEK